MNQKEWRRFLRGEWIDLPFLILNPKNEKEFMNRLKELDAVNYRGATLGREVRWFDRKFMRLNDDGVGYPVQLSAWQMKRVVSKKKARKAK